MRTFISVALATYRGVRFLESQLESIARQTRPVDEIVVVDDGSDDGTPEVVETAASRLGLPLRLFRKERNEGSTAAFADALRACTGDIVFFCDQDDVWYPDKVARTLAAMGDDAVLAFGDAVLVDSDGQSTGRRLFQNGRFDRRERLAVTSGRTFDVLLKHNVAAGTTMAFRTHLRESMLPIPALFVHDWWCALVAAAQGDVALITEPLLDYRQHPGQQVGSVTHTLRSRIRQERTVDHTARIQSERDRFALLAARLLERGFLDAAARTARKLDHFDRRLEIRRGRTSLAWTEFLTGRYRRYSSHPLMPLRDVVP
jgi:hypothetical protein